MISSYPVGLTVPELSDFKLVCQTNLAYETAAWNALWRHGIDPPRWVPVVPRHLQAPPTTRRVFLHGPAFLDP